MIRLAIIPVITSLTPDIRLKMAGTKPAAAPPIPHKARMIGMAITLGIGGRAPPATAAIAPPTINCPSSPMLIAPPWKAITAAAADRISGVARWMAIISPSGVKNASRIMTV